MSVGDTLDDKRKRRRERRLAQEQAPVEDAAVEDELDQDDEGDDDESSARGLSERKGRATPSRRIQETEVAETGNFITRRVRGLREYFEGVRSELDKVIWPSREETRRLTVIVVSTTIVASIALGMISLVFNELFVTGLRTPIVFGAVFAVVLGAFVYYLRQANRRTGGF